MARFSRRAVLEAIYEQGMLPIFNGSGSEFEVAKLVADSCGAAGSRLLEFTNRGDHACADFAQLEKYSAAEHPDLILGAGSVIDSETAAFFLNAGASFIVGPSFDAAVAKICNKRKIPYVPGCGSVTEIVTAYEAGVEFVKLFPAKEVGGPGFVKAVRGPLPWVTVIATGGVEIDSSLKKWFEAGTAAVGLGSALFPAAALKAGNVKAITAQVKKALTAVQKAKGGAHKL